MADEITRSLLLRLKLLTLVLQEFPEVPTSNKYLSAY
jgi:hypothetical protein